MTAKQPEPTPRSEWITAVKPKPLNGQVEKGLQWLVEQQHDDGGWDQGDTSLRQAETGESNVGDTCAASLALMRSGSTPSDGPYAPAIRKALGFIMKHVEESDPQNLSVSGGLHTRLHAKLGPNIDTFLASLVLTEADDAMPDKPSEDRLAAALDKVLYKIQINQGADGRWAGAGWAPALADAVAVKSLNLARQKGYEVPAAVLERAEAHAVGEFRAGRSVAAGGGPAHHDTSAARVLKRNPPLELTLTSPDHQSHAIL